MNCLKGDAGDYILVFAGKMADTGRDPMPIKKVAVAILQKRKVTEIIWASQSELYNIFQAKETAVQIITIANDILDEFSNVGKDIVEYSLETVKMYRNDAVKAGFTIGK